MAGRHSQQTKKSKAPVIIVIIAVVLVAAAAVVGVIYFVNGSFNSADNQETTVAVTTAAEQVTETAIPIPTETTQSSEQSDDNDDSSSSESQVIAVPTEEEGEITYFNATFIPNGTVVDTVTGNNTSLREVFGSGYNTDGVITFNSDGTFTDSISDSHAKSGAYVVQNESISATYEDDKNMEITVTEWDGDTPVSFYINYAGYNVYFG